MISYLGNRKCVMFSAGLKFTLTPAGTSSAAAQHSLYCKAVCCLHNKRRSSQPECLCCVCVQWEGDGLPSGQGTAKTGKHLVQAANHQLWRCQRTWISAWDGFLFFCLVFFYHMQAAMKAYLSFISLVRLVIGTKMSCVQERAEQSRLSLASAELRSQAALSAVSTVCRLTYKRDLSSRLYLCL